MAITTGADPVALRRLARELAQGAERLQDLGRMLESGLDSTRAWQGPDAIRFRSDWAGGLRPQLARVAAELVTAGQAVGRNADEQERASQQDSGNPSTSASGAASAIAGTGGSIGGSGNGQSSAETAADSAAMAEAITVPRGSPAAVADWWRSLTPEQQAALVEHQPDAIGNLDGVPGWARDRANRARLARLIVDLEQSKDAWPHDHPKETEAQLEALYGVRDALDRDQPTQLLLLDPYAPGQPAAAIAIGDVDTAEHVAVMTPGIGTTVAGSMANCTNDMAAMAARSEQLLAEHGSKDRVATVAWLGYDAPPAFDLFKLGDIGEITSRDNAVAGAPRLAGFAEGISAAHSGPVHLTALGHSYGSLTTGLAAQQTDAFDSMVVYGSPGLGTSDPGSLHVPEGQRFALRASGDVIAGTPAFGVNPTGMDHFTTLSTGGSEHGGGIFGHSEYLKETSTSQYNIAAVIAGRPDLAVEPRIPLELRYRR